jgi:uncharacterized protein (DUF697 family)/tellurite resistance protein
MDASAQRAALTLCLMAAFADGNNDDRERAAIERLARSFGNGDLDAVYQDVLLGKPDLDAVAAALPTPEEKRFAYEMAVGVCNADGAASQAEREFLERLAQALGVPAASAQEFAHEASTVANAAPSSSAMDGALVAAVPQGDADLDRMILNYAILNGALELLPQSLASMAIIPLQMRMVYRIGKAHGYELDGGHIKDLLATLGVGLTSQYLEQFGRKLVGGLLGSIGGGLLGGLGSAGTGAAFSFATTYALGHVAKRYYAGGRNIDTAGLQQAFSQMLGQAKQVQGQYTSQIVEQARSLDLNKVLAAIRG